MFKFVVFCTVIVCAVSAPTENPSESEATVTFSHEKSLLEESPLVTITSINSPSTDKREKRDVIPAQPAKPTESEGVNTHSQNKSLLEASPVATVSSIKSPSTENREKREEVATDKPIESEGVNTHSQNKSLLEASPVVKITSINSPSTQQREKRENIPAASSPSTDNKRISGPTQTDYQENKPPTFVHPVPVDQIIKNSHVSPQIHSNKHEEVDGEPTSEEEKIIVNRNDDDDNTENRKPLYNKRTIASKTNQSNEDHSHENH